MGAISTCLRVTGEYPFICMISSHPPHGTDTDLEPSRRLSFKQKFVKACIKLFCAFSGCTKESAHREFKESDFADYFEKHSTPISKTLAPIVPEGILVDIS